VTSRQKSALCKVTATCELSRSGIGVHTWKISLASARQCFGLHRVRQWICSGRWHPCTTSAHKPRQTWLIGVWLKVAQADQLGTAVFGAGCFWGPELAFQRVPGVVATATGYSQVVA